MKILVYGIGAMGSIYASLLSRLSNEVFVVDPWKEHISEIKKNGLKIEGASGNYTYKNINASFSIPKKIKFDLIIIATKASGVKKAAQDIKEFIYFPFGRIPSLTLSIITFLKSNVLVSSIPII